MGQCQDGGVAGALEFPRRDCLGKALGGGSGEFHGDEGRGEVLGGVGAPEPESAAAAFGPVGGDFCHGPA